MENLARYIIRASFSQERVKYLDQEGSVIYTAKACPGPRSGDRKTNKVFPAMEWLAAMCTHIPNRGEQMVRYYGYYINFASPSGGFIPKGITSPLVLDFNIFYSYFNPTTASCAGGTGTTSTYQVCNVMVPIANATAAATATAVNGCKSGLVLAWTGVASSLAARNIVSGVQAGLTSGSGTTDDTTAVQNLTLQNLNTQSSDRYPKIRVWRIVH